MGMAEAQREVYERLAGLIRDQLTPGEEVLGMFTASDSKLFTQQMYAIGVTPQRLVMVPVSLRWQPKGEPWSIMRDDVEGAKESDLKVDNDNPRKLFEPTKIVVASKIKIRTGDGRKLNLIANDALSGFGEGDGLEALRVWLGQPSDPADD
ncbi:MAG: hypothetical protein MUE78_04060 [Ilumatobacteraceae bacterium]|jgi:hypothetical protein|nr:hypothetical protein [Ilumatobacteraceae bacterium]